MIGIYKITNNVNHKVYIGSSIRVEDRLKEHVRHLNKGKHHSLHLQSAWDKYKQENFTLEIVEEVYSKEFLVDREQYWCDLYKANDRLFGYNVRLIVSSNYGNKVTISPEARRKISEANKGKIPKNLASIQEMSFTPVSFFYKGEYIKDFKSQMEACRELGISRSAINARLKGIVKSFRTFPDYTFTYKTQ